MPARNLYQLSLVNEDTKEGLWIVSDEATLEEAKQRCTRMLQAAHKNGVALRMTVWRTFDPFPAGLIGRWFTIKPE